ncbi:MAG: energy transducer TonB [Flavisolibacter sp.]
MTQSPGNNFNGSDIQRYHSGQMTSEERHALEKAALDDPFLADAIEGFAYTTTASEDLVSIRSRLDQKTHRKKVILLFTKTWMKVAAILIVVAGGVWLLLNTENASSEKLAVEQEIKKDNTENKASGLPIPLTDSVSTEQAFMNTDDSKKIVSGNKDESHKIDNRKVLELPDEMIVRDAHEKQKNDNSKELKNQAMESHVYSAPAQNNVATGSINYNSDRRIGNEMRNAPEVNVQNRLANQQVNANRVRSWTESDSVPSGFIAQQRLQSDSVTQLNVIMTPQPSAPLNEIVVSKTVAKKETDMKGRMSVMVIDTLEPAEGWTNFDDYIAGNLKVPAELKLKPVDRGEVELAFEVNQKGKPVNITVVRSLCAKCDEEAKRLLKEGPKWKKRKNKKGKVTIRF